MRLLPFALSNVDGARPVSARGAKQMAMDARNIRIGETSLEELIQWLRQTGQPQTLETLNEQYVTLLKSVIGVKEGS